MKRKKCCNFKKVRYRTDYPATDSRAYTEVHAKGCLKALAKEKG